jgi:hypothetical protein
MFQQLIAIIIILFFISRSYWHKRTKAISDSEFLFWLVFWIISAGLIIFIKKIDLMASGFGFSSRAIDIFVYLGIPILFYLIFKLRIKIDKLEKEITKIVREIALK